VRRGQIHSKTSAFGYGVAMGLILILCAKGCGRLMDWRGSRATVERMEAENGKD